MKPATESLEAAADAAREDAQASIINASGKESYPIASFTWLYVPEAAKTPARKSAVEKYVGWLLGPGQELVAKQGFAPLPPAIAAKSVAKLGGL